MNRTTDNELDRRHLWHPYTRFSTIEAAPLPIIRAAEGIHLIDTDGTRYIDAISSWWCCALGHGHPRIVAAIREQAAELQHSILGNLSHPRAVELAARLAALMPTPARHVLFASDGASAVEAALKIAVQFQHNSRRPEKNRFAYLEDAYHGDTLGAVSVGYLEGFHRPFESILFPATELPVPRDRSDEDRCMEQTRALLKDKAQHLAGLIIEPLCQGAAGMRMYSADYLSRLAALCTELDILLIDDEIATGFGRTGSLFAFEQAGIDPDIVCVGKALSAGYLPISATIVKDRLYDTFNDKPEDHSFYHGHTFCGNPIAAAAALAALDIYEELDIAAKARTIEAAFRESLEPLAALESVKNVRILGAIGAVEFKGETEAHAAAKEDSMPRAQAVRTMLLDQGILLRPLGNIVYLMPPLTISEEQLQSLLDAFCGAIRAA